MELEKILNDQGGVLDSFGSLDPFSTPLPDEDNPAVKGESVGLLSCPDSLVDLVPLAAMRRSLAQYEEVGVQNLKKIQEFVGFAKPVQLKADLARIHQWNDDHSLIFAKDVPMGRILYDAFLTRLLEVLKELWPTRAGEILRDRWCTGVISLHASGWVPKTALAYEEIDYCDFVDAKGDLCLNPDWHVQKHFEYSDGSCQGTGSHLKYLDLDFSPRLTQRPVYRDDSSSISRTREKGPAQDTKKKSGKCSSCGGTGYQTCGICSGRTTTDKANCSACGGTQVGAKCRKC